MQIDDVNELMRQVKQQAVEIARGCRDYGGGGTRSTAKTAPWASNPLVHATEFRVVANG